MTYLFFAIALGLITAISKGSWDDLGIMCVIMLALTALLEGGVLMKKEQTKEIVYDKIGLITPEKNEELIEDLKLRTGLNIHRVNIQEVDFLKDSTKIIIFYYTKK
jgi:hypothetical protein